MSEDQPVNAPQSDWKGLFAGVVRESRKVIENEAIVVRSEWQERSRLTKQTIVQLLAGAICALLALGFLSSAIAFGLNAIMPAWLAVFIVGILWTLGSGMIGYSLYNHQREIEEENQASRPVQI